MKNQGFTLIEIMVTVAIVAILAAIAIPSYSDYVVRSKLAEAHSLLTEQRVRMEQFFQDNRTYVGACASGSVAEPQRGKHWAQSTCSNLTATTYTITAVPDDAAITGFAFTINEKNERATTSAKAGWATNSNCWVTKKDGSC